MAHHWNVVSRSVAAAIWLLTQDASCQSPDANRTMIAATSKKLTPSGAREELDLKKLELEADKLEVEIKKLKDEGQDPALAKLKAEVVKLRAEADNIQPWWGALVGSFLGFLAIAITGWLAWRQALSNRISSFDMKIFEARIEGYGKIVAAIEALSLYAPYREINDDTCESTAKRLKAQFYGLNGLLLTKESQKRYLALVHALMRAASEKSLNVPKDQNELRRSCWDDDVLMIARSKLGLSDAAWSSLAAEERSAKEIRAVEKHTFGSDGADPVADFVVLHFAASRLRTALIDDIKSRRRIN